MTINAPHWQEEKLRRFRAIKDALDAGYPPPGARNFNKLGALQVAAKALGISKNAMVSFWAHYSDEMIKHFDLDMDHYLRALKKPVGAIEPCAAAQAQRSEDEINRLRSALKSSNREISRLIEKISDLEWTSQVSYHPANWSYEKKLGSDKSSHIPYLLASDFQIGEVIDGDATGGNAYSTDVFRSRYRNLIESTIAICMDHVGRSWEFPGIIYARGGDAISGGIHDELARTEDLDPFDCVIACVEEESRGILELAKAFGKVEVKSVFGNHGRIDKKPPTKKMTRRNYEYIIGKMLMDRFKEDDRVSFQVTDSPDLYFPIYGQNICLTHGDNIGSRGGQGFVGPVATIARGAQKVIQQQAAMGRTLDRVDMGHFHVSNFGGYFLSNGSLPGYSEFAFNFRMRPEPPQQWLLFHNEKFGVVDLRLIRLDK